MFDRVLLLSHAGFTLAMVGVMWAVQLVIYPQFRSVAPSDFSQYASDHAQRMIAVLAVFAPVEVLLALAIWLRAPEGVPSAMAFVAGLLLVVAWVGTGVWYAPLHGRLQTEPYDIDRIQLLIRTNWIRTALWTARGVLALVMVARFRRQL